MKFPVYIYFPACEYRVCYTCTLLTIIHPQRKCFLYFAKVRRAEKNDVGRSWSFGIGLKIKGTGKYWICFTVKKKSYFEVKEA